MFTIKQICTAFLLSVIIVPGVSSQPVEPNGQTRIHPGTEQDYAMLVRNYNHLRAAVKTVDMLSDDNHNIGNFEVILCGNKITQINSNEDLINEAQQKGITITACGMSMNKFSIDESELPDGVQVVQNGLIRIFDLQEKGYQTITL
ncbi:DsrE family protein [Fodinibius sp.]|uniref:DsrE family protein n=1 Tax=Fodinibius sp. TaxID=1872440 RepID=UPI003561C0E5